MTGPMNERYEVVSPLGREGMSTREVATGVRTLSRLDGATIGFAFDYAFRGDEMFDAIKGAIDARHTGVRYVHHDVFGNIHGVNEPEVVAAIPGQLAKHRVDALIVGIGA